jgi:hypothetical protein
MEDITDEVVVSAPVARVWKAIQDPAEHVEWHPFATRIEGEHSPGAVRECSVLVGRRRGTTRERCSSYDEGSEIMWAVEQDSSGFARMVADWRSGFSLQAQGLEQTRVRAHSTFQPRPLARVMMPLIRRKFHQTQRAILDGLRQHVEH